MSAGLIQPKVKCDKGSICPMLLARRPPEPRVELFHIRGQAEARVNGRGGDTDNRDRGPPWKLPWDHQGRDGTAGKCPRTTFS